MMKSIKSYIVLSGFLSFSLIQDAVSQNFEFSQFFASRLYLNPTFAAAEPHTSFSGVHRTQWTALGDPFVSTQFSVIHPLFSKTQKEENWGGVGVSLVRDAAANGELVNTGVNANMGYILNIKSKMPQHFIFGMQLGMVQKTASFEVGWGNQYRIGVGLDPNQPSGESDFVENKIVPDVGVGGTWSGQFGKKARVKHLQLGLAGFHLNRPNQSFINGERLPLPPVFKFHGRLDVPSHRGITVSPNFIAIKQAGLVQVNAGLSFLVTQPKHSSGHHHSSKGFWHKTDFICGAWYRLGDAYIFAAGLNNEHVTAILSFDLNNSSLQKYTNGRGATEISIAYRYIKKTKVQVERKRFDTPRM